MQLAAVLLLLLLAHCCPLPGFLFLCLSQQPAQGRELKCEEAWCNPAAIPCGVSQTPRAIPAKTLSQLPLQSVCEIYQEYVKRSKNK